MDEAETLQAHGAADTWTPTGETVGKRWARLSNKELPAWLLRLGVTYTVECVRAPVRKRGNHGLWDAGEWTVTPSWPAPDDATVLVEQDAA